MKISINKFFKQFFLYVIYTFLPCQYHTINLSFEVTHSTIESRVMHLFLSLSASYALNHIQYHICGKRKLFVLVYL